MLGLELTQRVPLAEQSPQPGLMLDAANARLAPRLLDHDLVAGPDSKLVAHALGQYHLAFGPYAHSHTVQYNPLRWGTAGY